MTRIEKCFMNLAAAIIAENCGSQEFLESQWGKTLKDFCGIADGKNPEIEKAKNEVQRRAAKENLKTFVMPEDQELVNFIW